MKSKLLNKLLVFSFILAVILSASSCSKEQPVIMSSNFARADSIGVANTKGTAVKKSVAMDMAYETEESVDNGVYESSSPNFEHSQTFAPEQKELSRKCVTKGFPCLITNEK